MQYILTEEELLNNYVKREEFNLVLEQNRKFAQLVRSMGIKEQDKIRKEADEFKRKIEE